MIAAPFDPGGALPTGVTVLQASAGTGKTYTIAGLVARYVAEGVRLPRLLVVTFTRAATTELRDRVRTRLLDAAEYLDRVGSGQGAKTSDEFFAAMAEGDTRVLAERRRRLLAALAEFDAATIATIHGFCQHVLSGIGLAADMDRGARFLEDQTELIEATTDDLYVRMFAHGGDESIPSRREAVAIARRVVDNPDALIVPGAPEHPDAAIRVRFAQHLRDEVNRRKRAAGVLSYNDLLTRLAETLADPTTGAAARDRLRGQYQVALIDEFQDTDPVQWDILSRLFGGGESALVLIGDPKQAIYAFRGADVYAYLTAVRQPDQASTLATNWRSDAGLLHAYNVLFNGATLGHPDIAYQPVLAAQAHRQPRLRGAPTAAPLRLRVVRRDANVRMDQHNAKKIQVDSARAHVARDLAAEVVALLESGAQIVDRAADGTERRSTGVCPHHLAVLVRTNADAALIQRELRDANVPAVINGVGSVFSTAGAVDWLRLLEALERPASPPRVRAVALTSFLGWSAGRVVEAHDDEWDALRERLHLWARLLRDHGVASLIRTIMHTEQLPERLLQRLSGERQLTDLQHVGELLHAAAVAEELGLTSLLGWLRERIADADADTSPDERSRRLESDDEAVQVLTVHRSKGLEFPIVYCPFLWTGGWPHIEVPVFHDPEQPEPRRYVDVGKEQPDFADHKKAAVKEQQGENLRLLYVALTRARHQAVVWWAPGGRSDLSPLARLLFCRSRDGTARTLGTPGLPDDTLTIERLGALSSAADGAITVETTPADPRPRPWAGSSRNDTRLEAARFDRRLDHRWRRTSYSALTRRGNEPHVSSEPDEPVTDDEQLAAAVAAGASVAQAGTARFEVAVAEERLRDVGLPLAEMPGGTEIGTFVHAVLEHTDFTAQDLDAELSARVTEQLARRQLGVGDARQVVAGLRAAITTPTGPLTGGVRLRDLTWADRLDELDFELPLGAPGSDVTVGAIGDLLRHHLPADDPLGGYAERLRDPSLRHGALRGYLTGSIDAVLRVRDGGGDSRFFVVDYKTNRLAAPDESLSLWHYRPSGLAEAMERGHYPLQALLYSVALHRYLRWRLRRSGYDPERHLGGILYLFLRGMAGGGAPTVAGNPCGVFAWRPPAALIVDLGELLDRGKGRAEVPPAGGLVDGRGTP